MSSNQCYPAHRRLITLLVLLGGVFPTSLLAAKTDPLPAGWRRQAVEWRLTSGLRIRAINHPPTAAPPTLESRRPDARTRVRRQGVDRKRFARRAAGIDTAPITPSVLVIDSPPIDGFQPWLAVLATDKDKFDEWDAEPSTSVLGDYLTPNPQTDYALGLLDTGAGICVLGNTASTTLGLFAAGYSTGGTVTITGVTGSVDAWVSHPFGLFFDGLSAVNPTTLQVSDSAMVGTWNLSTAMGPEPAPGAPDLVTAIGSPAAVFFASSVRTDITHTIERDGTLYTAPDIHFHTLTDPTIPTYPNRVPLELRPLGAADVMYWPCFEILGEYCPGGDGSPQLPSFILGATAQSLFFVSSVDLYEGTNSAIDRTKFMLDTGAQVTVIGSSVSSRLRFNSSNPDFTVDITGVDGQTTIAPGFYVDALDIPADGEWLSYTNVPVVLLDVASPEGGVLDGIIGMNLLNEYNFVLRGGGLPNMGTPGLFFEPALSVPGHPDFDQDGDVDMTDFGHLQVCYSGVNVSQTRTDCQDARLDPDDDVDLDDFDILAGCAAGPNVPYDSDCLP